MFQDSALDIQNLLNGEEQPEFIFYTWQLTIRNIPRFLVRDLVCKGVQTLRDLLQKLIYIKFYSFCKSLIFTTKFKRFTIFDVYTFFLHRYYVIVLYPSDVTLNGAPCQG